MNMPQQMAEIIEKIIRQKSMVVSTVLKECNLNKDTIGTMKRGNEPAAKVISTLADYLSVSTDYIFGKTDDPTPPNKKNGLSPEKLKLLDEIGYAYFGRGDRELDEDDVNLILEMAELTRKMKEKEKNKNN